MPREEIPITPALLTWARERAGYSSEEISQHFKKIDAWESGRAFPTYPQLERLAEKFKVPIAVFFFPEPPDLPPLSETFRTLPEAEFSRIPRRIKFLLRKAKALQINLAELYLGRNPAQRLIFRDLEFPPNIRVEEMARQVRAYLHVPMDEQLAWVDNDAALKAWRINLLNVGVFVFKDAFREEDFSGFCLYDQLFPIIYVNNSSSKTRQIFSLFHELAHLIFHTSGIDTIADNHVPALPNPARRIEILCNRFAAEFLVPEDAFDEAFAGKGPSVETAEELANRFHVSREVIYRRFLDRNLIGADEYHAAAARWAEQRPQQRPGGNPYWTKISYLGRDYIALAFSQYHQNRIDESKLAEYLDIKPRYINALEDYYTKGGV